MKILKDNRSNNRNRNRLLFIILTAIFLVLIILIINQFKDEHRFTVVKLYGNKSALNYSKDSEKLIIKFNGHTSLLAEKGDLLIDGDSFFRFNGAKDDSLNLNYSKDSSLFFINGKLNTISITKEANLIPWFIKMKPETIENLETINITSKIPDSYVPYLRKISNSKPNIDLIFTDSDGSIFKDFIKRITFFKPSLLMVRLKQDELGLLTHFKTIKQLNLDLIDTYSQKCKGGKNLDCYNLELSDSVVIKQLPTLPDLKEITLSGSNFKSVNSTFFAQNIQLKKIKLDLNPSDYNFLKPLKNIEQLVLDGSKTTSDLSALRNNFPKLSILVLSGNFKNYNSIGNNKKIRWLGIPENTSQKQFDSIPDLYPNLQIMAYKGKRDVTSLKKLQQLPNLRGLLISDTVTDKQTLHSLKNLKFLSIPFSKKNKTDSIYLKSLEKSLPGCVISPNGGVCMGSGWLLALIPFVFLFSIIIRSKQLK